jgi:transposase
VVADALKNPAAEGKKPRLMFQDEARFGRMSRPRRCWAPAGTRPMMQNGYEREFTYVYGAVSPLEGTMDYRLSEKMNTEQMGVFLQQVSRQYPDEYVLMVVDGASSHKAKALEVPANISLIPLPGYSPQLNPQENVWDEIREKNFPNRVYDSMTAVRDQLTKGLAEFAAATAAVTSLTAWPWIREILS